MESDGGTSIKRLVPICPMDYGYLHRAAEGTNMNEDIKKKVAEVIANIQKDPSLLAEFSKNPSKTIEKVANIQIPDLLEPSINKMAKEGIAKNADPMEIVKKFLG